MPLEKPRIQRPSLSFNLAIRPRYQFLAVPFEFAYKRQEHFDKHCLRRREFPCATDVEYEALAEHFLVGPLGDNVLQCRRPQGDIVRYDTVTEEFGVFGRNGFIITYFLARPANHGYASNVCYMYVECWRIF
jgi:hypothetical protein